MTSGGRFRIGVIGFAQMHVVTLVKSFAAHPERVEWVGAADIEPLVEGLSSISGTRKSNMAAVLKICGLDTNFDDYREVISRKPDIIIVCAENYIHGKLCCEILEQGINVVLEKPMAMTLADSLMMARSAKDGGAKLIVNWPVAWWPSFYLAEGLARKGAAGRIFKFHYRNRDSLGPYCYGTQVMPDNEKKLEWWYQKEPGGGAMLDYCCYGCSLSRWIVGEKPVAAFAMKANVMSQFAQVEDYATMIVKYPVAFALLEGSWATLSGGGVSNGPVIFGDAGTIVSDRYSSQVRVYNKLHGTEPDAVYDAPPLPAGRDNIANEVFHHFDTGDALHPLIDLPVNIDAMAALDAGIKSSESGKLEPVADSFWVR